jgi:hypothetical protein
VAPHPTAGARDERTGDPLDRGEYAARLRRRLAGDAPDDKALSKVTVGLSEVAALLLDELAGVYRGEDLGALAAEVAGLLRERSTER